MNASDPTQLPPAGTAIPDQVAAAVKAPPADTANLAGVGQGEPVIVTSQQKIHTAIEQLAAIKGPAVVAIVTPLLAQLNLPEDPAQLDQLLSEGAAFLLTLRSDGAAPLSVISGTAQPNPVVEQALSQLEGDVTALRVAYPSPAA